MRLANWRDADLDGFVSVWPQLTDRWRSRLSWDTAANWAAIDAQRRSGELPGLAVVDGATLAAWTFFVVHRGVLQVGGFEARDAEAARLLIDAVLTLGAEFAPDGALLFAFTDAPDLEALLRERRFDSERYLYLTHTIDATNHAAPVSERLTGAGARAHESVTAGERGLRPVSTSALAVCGDDDGGLSDASSRPASPELFAARLPSLLASAYDRPVLTRPFAWHGQRSEWDEYATQLTATAACGRFDFELSAAVWWPDGDLRAAVVATIIAPDTVHLAQVAVAPESRGNHLAWSLLDDVRSRARARGMSRISLLVGERNAAARRLYERFGFTGTETFVSAGRRGQ